MTDEEMAEEYAVENWEHYKEGQTDYKALKQAFLAGLKAAEKENAILKEKLKPENCLKMLAKEGYIKFSSDQLTKAKEIIRDLLGCLYSVEYDCVSDLEEAERFLNEE